MRELLRGVWGLAAIAVVGATCFAAGVASAGPNKLDAAKAGVAQALSDLRAAELPEAAPAYGAHRDKAVRLLTRAQGEILKAEQHAR